MLSIVGAGGMGKTTVAVAVAEGFAACVSDGAWFVDLASLRPQLEKAEALQAPVFSRSS